jgi:Domain of unknown function (DUF4262)
MPHRHFTMNELLQQIREGIALQGFAIRHVLPSSSWPAYTYTVGLHQAGTSVPELVISGLSTETRVAWMLELGFQIKGPPPLATQQQMEKALAPGQTLAFPPGGRVFQPGVIYRDLADNGLPACFGVVLPQSYEASFGQALAFHGTSAFPVLQMIWSDTRGTFPWEPSFEQRFQGQQQLLCDPSRFLPLKKETDTPS